MIVITETTDKIQVVLDSAVATNELDCFVSYREITKRSYVPKRNTASTNGTTDVDLVTSPASDTQRLIDYISIYNKDTVNAVVTVKHDIGGTEIILIKQTLNAGKTLQFNDHDGWRVA